MADQPHPKSGSGEDAGSAGAEPGRPLSTTRPPMDGIPVGVVVSSVVREDDSGDPTDGDTTAVVSNAKAEGAGIGGGTGAPDLNPGIEAAAADIDADDYAIYDPLSRDQYSGEDDVAYQQRRSISMVFVYGTLRPDNDTGSMHTARFAADMAVKIKATVRGARLLVDTLYPSAVWLAGEGADDLQDGGGDAVVHGYVVAASNKRMFIDMIDRGDRYEGVDRNPPLFRKTCVTAIDDEGNEYRCFFYYRNDVSRELEIESGDWLQRDRRMTVLMAMREIADSKATDEELLGFLDRVDEANGALNDTERLHTSMSLYFDWMLSQIPDE